MARRRSRGLAGAGSRTALGGLEEEAFVARYLNERAGLRAVLAGFADGGGGPRGGRQAVVPAGFRRARGRGKTDVVDARGALRIQVKKTRALQFGQVGRHYVDELVRVVPGLGGVPAGMLKGLCELPVLAGTGRVDRSAGGVTPLAPPAYSAAELGALKTALAANKRALLEFTLRGRPGDPQPDLLALVDHRPRAGGLPARRAATRSGLAFVRLADVVDALCERFEFEISAGATVLHLGRVFSLQRKGGDGGRKTSNQLQFKVMFSRLLALPGLPAVRVGLP